MNKFLFGTACFLLSFQFLNAQTTKQADDSIKTTIIDPEVMKANHNNAVPDWEELTITITSKYNAEYADRTITKAKIYYYWYRDWAIFSSAIVHYTESWEDKNNLSLMVKNANFILQHSENELELKTALSWIKPAIDKEPSNTKYKEVYDGLVSKIKQ
jgi:hypothetical protein